MQILKDKFELPTGTPPQTPAKPGTTMSKHKDEEVLKKCIKSTEQESENFNIWYKTLDQT